MTPAQYAAARTLLFARTSTILLRLWSQQTSYTAADVRRFQATAVPILQGAQRAVGQMVAVRVASSATAAKRRTVRPPSIPDDQLVALRHGVTVEKEYERPFAQARYGLSLGEDQPTAAQRGRIRLEALADVDLQMTEASAARSAMESTGATWWKRVPAGAHTCLLCLVASTRVYHVGTLKPIHPGCDCGIAEQFSSIPGEVHDTDLLKQANQAVIAATGRYHSDAETLRDLLVDFTQHHEETGPWLAFPRGVQRTAAA